MNTTDMNHVFVRPTETKEVVRYEHPYGGVASQIRVTKEQFGRFFNVSELVLDDLPVNMKVYDVSDGHMEWLGYKIELFGQPTTWVITAVNYKREPEHAA